MALRRLAREQISFGYCKSPDFSPFLLLVLLPLSHSSITSHPCFFFFLVSPPFTIYFPLPPHLFSLPFHSPQFPFLSLHFSPFISLYLCSSPLSIYSPFLSRPPSSPLPFLICSSSVFFFPSPCAEKSIRSLWCCNANLPQSYINQTLPPCQKEKKNSPLSSKWKNSFQYCSGYRGQLWLAINFTHT